MARDRNYTDAPINYYQAVCHPHETINSVAPVHRRANKLSRPSARAISPHMHIPLPSLLFYVHIFFLQYSRRYLTIGRLMKIFPAGERGAFIAPTRFWHDRWFICFDNTVVAFRCNHPAKCQNVSIDLRTFAISCFGYRESSVSIALPYYRNLRDKKHDGIIVKLSAHFSNKCQLFNWFLLLIFCVCTV